MNIGICTSFYNNYGRFFDRWINSIDNLTIKPNAITVVLSGKDHGLDIPTPIVNNINITPFIYNDIKFIYLPEHISMGNARNKAVEHTNTEYIQYLDIDDEILPNALEVYNKYPNYDVISGGLRIKGAKENKDILFNATNQRQRLGKHCCCSHALYKKSFWNKSKYIETNDYIEQPFWIKLAQLGATFISTEEICTIYNTRADGHNMSLTRQQREEAKIMRQRIIEGEYD